MGLPRSLIRRQPSLNGGWEVDQTGGSRDNRFSCRMADDEGRVLVAQSFYSVAIAYALQQLSCRVQNSFGRVARNIEQIALQSR
jgi:hypothetical protein